MVANDEPHRKLNAFLFNQKAGTRTKRPISNNAMGSYEKEHRTLIKRAMP